VTGKKRRKVRGKGKKKKGKIPRRPGKKKRKKGSDRGQKKEKKDLTKKRGKTPGITEVLNKTLGRRNLSEKLAKRGPSGLRGERKGNIKMEKTLKEKRFFTTRQRGRQNPLRGGREAILKKEKKEKGKS